MLTAIVVVYSATTLLLMHTTADGPIATSNDRIAEPSEVRVAEPRGVRIAEPREAAHPVPETVAFAAVPASAAVVTVASSTADVPKTREAVAIRESRREPPSVRLDPQIQRVSVSSPATAELPPIVEPPIAPLLGSPPPASPRVELRPVVDVPATLPRPEASAAPVPRMPPPEAAIQSALSRYQTAYRDLDAGAARAVWPSVDSKALSKAFDRLEQQDLFFDSCQIAVNDVRAVASCQGFARYVPRVGSKAPRDDQRQWEFKLSKVADIWLIDTVSAR